MNGIILSNLGTPQSPDPLGVKNYLGEFLMDPAVIPLPFPLRWLLVHGIILQTRPTKSSHAYQQIWTERGSPLLFHTQDLAQKVTTILSTNQFRVAVGMRYGKPSIEKAFRELAEAGATKVTLFPLYPHLCFATTESSIEAFEQVAKLFPEIKTHIIPEFFSDSGFVGIWAEKIRVMTSAKKYDHVLFTYHGLPAKQDSDNAYKNRCTQTTDLIRERLGLSNTDCSTAFQSRLGRGKWIQPYTEEIYEQLASSGKKNILVVAPSFVADCLETLEELSIRGKESFLSVGGLEYDLVPSLNSDPEWVNWVANTLQNK